MARQLFLLVAMVVVAAIVGAAQRFPPAYWAFVVVGPIILVGLHDMLQTRHTILRNFPVIGHGRYLFEALRPEMHQYFIESDISGRPFSREMRSVVYQRAKRELDTLPFGTRRDVHAVGYEWLDHTLDPHATHDPHPRVDVGGPDCDRPYSASILNISAMSYGALSDAAVLALNGAARDGNFAHNTGEGGVSPYHREPGGDLIWQVGTGYFGCRTAEGDFDADRFCETVASDTIKMVELKLSQGAKPSHGGILPGVKVSPEIATIRGVPAGKDVISPSKHTAFHTPTGLLEFLAHLRELGGGRPVGFKLCIGRPVEFMAICKAMLETKIMPDFIAIDGGEGGTGAAPVEFSNSVGTPLFDGLALAHDVLVGAGLREHIRVFASGRVVTGFHMASRLALGADVIYSARSMMFALGCIQALRCNHNTCPTGITTQDRSLIKGLVVSDKRERVAKYHAYTLRSLAEITAAAGVEHPTLLRREMFRRRISATQVATYEDIYPSVEPGQFLDRPPERYAAAWARARADAF